MTSVGTSEAAVTASAAGVLNGPHAAAAKTSAGQCQTYHAYEMRPTKRTGRSDSARVGSAGVALLPAATSAAAPSVGSSVGSAGTAVSRHRTSTVATAIAASPHHASAAPPSRPSRRPVEAEREQAAERQLPRPRAGGEVRLLGSLRHALHRVRERGDGDDAQRRAEPAPGRPIEQQERPHDVELLLDRERPEVVERAVGGAGREVVDRRRPRGASSSRRGPRR